MVNGWTFPFSAKTFRAENISKNFRIFEMEIYFWIFYHKAFWIGKWRLDGGKKYYNKSYLFISVRTFEQFSPFCFYFSPIIFLFIGFDYNFFNIFIGKTLRARVKRAEPREPAVGWGAGSCTSRTPPIRAGSFSTLLGKCTTFPNLSDRQSCKKVFLRQFLQ